MNKTKGTRDESSFRDPSGYVFYWKDKIIRSVNYKYKINYDFLVKSGLQKELANRKLIISQKEIKPKPGFPKGAYKYLDVEKIPFISYPYELSFSQLKDAALLTLEVQKISLKHKMVLKDASAYNIQFIGSRPLLVDTLSFEVYRQDEPWVAYRQFCQHFLAPLALMGYKDIRLNQLLRIYIDGIPLDLTTKLLPTSSKFKFGIFSHIYMHSRSQKHYADKKVDNKTYKLSKNRLLALTDSLESSIRKLKLRKTSTEWAEYYTFTNYSKTAFEDKKRIVKSYILKTKPKVVWDLGANTGVFSNIAAKEKAYTISFDIDPIAVEKNYLSSKERKDKHLLPLVLDLTNPSGSIGWSNIERKSLIKRGPADTILALALIHHLAISNNLPFENIASFFHKICQNLIIEFVPKEDSQVQKLLSTREDIFNNYNKKSFEKEFGKYYKILNKERVANSKRTIYLLCNK